MAEDNYFKAKEKVNNFLRKGLNVTKSEAKEILENPYTTVPLLEVLDDSEIIENENFWQMLHTTILLSAKKEQKAIEMILHILEIDSDVYNDFLTEGMASYIFNFGIEKLDLLLNFLEDNDQGCFCRSAISGAVFQLSKHYPEIKNKVLESYNKLLDMEIEGDDDRTFLDMIADDIAYMQNKELFDKFVKLQKKEKVVGEGDWKYIEEYYKNGIDEDENKRNTENPMNHFEKENLEYLKEINQPKEIKKIKLGRNELCHCGSGKKYKKCCLKKDW